MNRYLENEQATLDFSAKLAAAFVPPAVIYLKGDLGAGKTTLVRGILNSLGWHGRVKSPTYGLVEPYSLDGIEIYHFDLYRLASPDELEFIGIRDYITESGIWFVEWPERGVGVLPGPDLVIHLEYQSRGRQLSCVPISRVGHEIINKLA